MTKHLQQLNQLLIDNHFYALVLSSGLAIGLFAGRVWWSHSRALSFMLWNLFLAWVPYFWSLWALSIHRRYPRRWWSLLLPGTLWLLFFPNAPYLITDLIHLYQRPVMPLWYDLGLLVSFVWAGCFLAVASLNMIHQIIQDYVSHAWSWFIVVGIMGLSGLGVYVGRFLRWNSWDLFLYPAEVLHDIGHRLIHPFSHLQIYGVTLLFAAFLFVCYGTFVSLKQHA